jgi:MFS transporter, FSR family, fosmidomycin resistance protein
MSAQEEATGLSSNQKLAENTVFAVLIAISVSHLLNDTIQSVIPAIYPILKESFHLNFTQIGLITLTFQLTASLLQPFVGLYTDHRPQPYSLFLSSVDRSLDGVSSRLSAKITGAGTLVRYSR